MILAASFGFIGSAKARARAFSARAGKAGVLRGELKVGVNDHTQGPDRDFSTNVLLFHESTPPDERARMLLDRLADFRLGICVAVFGGCTVTVFAANHGLISLKAFEYRALRVRKHVRS